MEARARSKTRQRHLLLVAMVFGTMRILREFDTYSCDGNFRHIQERTEKEQRMRTNGIKVFLPSFTIFLLLAGALSAKGDEAASVLSVQIRGNDNKEPQFGKRIHNEMHFVVFAQTKLVKVFQEWCSWGYYTRSFVATEGSAPSLQYTFTRGPQSWSKNFPATHEIKPGEFLVTNIDFCDGSWRVSPKLPKRDIVLELTGRLLIPVDKESKELGVWTGEQKTNALEVIIREDCIDPLNTP
jgi:hypothetical protein